MINAFTHHDLDTVSIMSKLRGEDFLIWGVVWTTDCSATVITHKVWFKNTKSCLEHLLGLQIKIFYKKSLAANYKNKINANYKQFYETKTINS